MGTSGFLNHELGQGGETLGIVAPSAMQRATLEEHCGPPAGTVPDGELLDVENRGVHTL